MMLLAVSAVDTCTINQVDQQSAGNVHPDATLQSHDPLTVSHRRRIPTGVDLQLALLFLGELDVLLKMVVCDCICHQE